MSDYNNEFHPLTAADWFRGLKAARERRATVSERHPTHNQLKKAVMEKEQINDGGPAFPAPMVPYVDGGFTTVQFAGMSLRDYFAGRALTGLLTSIDRDDAERFKAMGNTAAAALWATHSYIIADAMLAARNAPLTGA